jgi:TRAP-type mannitol/chloroaromatic compound transport system permease small subunit
MTTSASSELPTDAFGHDARGTSSLPAAGPRPGSQPLVRVLRILAGSSVAAVLLYLVNSYLTFWLDWPGVPVFLADREWLGLGPLRSPLEDAAIGYGWAQLLLYPAALAAVVAYVIRTPLVSLRAESDRLAALAAFVIRAAFWAVLLIGVADWVISAARVEGVLQHIVGQSVSDELGRPTFRGVYVHYPLLAAALLIACFTRTLGFPWLALLIVVAEIQIVLSRFVFSYEQAYMGDLVRFWYAALFLFASAYALPHEGHVRVDVFYARFTKQGKARTNAFGSLLLGLPLCWVILTTGMWQKGNSLISPLISYEISQSGFGMYVKYLMAGFLIIYATSMAIQFTSYFLSAVADLRREPDGPDEPVPEQVEA